MRALVTGGLGLIGHKVVQQLVQGHDIPTAILDSLTNYDGAVNMKELGYLFGERLKSSAGTSTVACKSKSFT